VRERFKWYLSPSDAEIREIWETGILTVDANVLLDTYRYHEKTRKEIREAIDAFEDRVWLSDQAANEFFRNRKTVIASAEKTFREVEESFRELRAKTEGVVATLKGYRLIPSEELEQLSQKVLDAISVAETQFSKSKSGHPNYLQSDPILDWIVTRFEGRLGNEPSAEELELLHKEAGERVQAKIPPGYLDGDKTGVRSYGDFMLWRQTLSHGKVISLPIILVTSERKEDWWEKISGKTVGPRIELLKEALEYSGQRVLIYQTDNFLRVAAERIGRTVNEAVVEEIRQVSNRRFTPLEGAISVDHLPDDSGESGLIEVTVLRPVQNFTCTVHFAGQRLNFRGSEVLAELLAYPSNLPKNLIRGRSDQKGEVGIINVHLHSLEHANPLPVGRYVFNYFVKFTQDSQPLTFK
jgi:predicted nucleic acid-binding protein